MEKRYQVFVSSTYRDLVDERRHVVQALLEMDCIPAGMELFPAADEEQLEFIKGVINDCDYYILILAGRYGSTDGEGISFTEREFEHALSQGIPVLAFVHRAPSALPPPHQESEPATIQKLASFRERVQTGRVCRPWENHFELAGAVTKSLLAAIRTKPRPGWIRGLTEDPAVLLEQINDLRKRNDELQKQLLTPPKSQDLVIANLAPLSEAIALEGSYAYYRTATEGRWRQSFTWEDLFAIVSPDLMMWTHEETVSKTIATAALSRSKGLSEPSTGSVDLPLLQTVRIQMMALGLVDVQPKTTVANTVAFFWGITQKGKDLLISLRTVKRKS